VTPGFVHGAATVAALEQGVHAWNEMEQLLVDHEDDRARHRLARCLTYLCRRACPYAQ
jgi:hypothetical protein